MAGEGFKIAGAFVEVNLQDNTEEDEKRIRARLEGAKPVKFDTALNEPENLELVRERVKSIGPVDIQVKANADLGSAAAAGTAMAEWTNAAEQGTRSRLSAAGDEAGSDFTRKASDRIRNDRSVESATESVAKRAEAKFSALQFAAMFAGLPAAAAVAGAGVAVGLSAVPLVFAGLSIAAVRSNTEVSNAFDQLRAKVSSSVDQMAAPIQGTLVQAIANAQNAFMLARPQIAELFRASQPLLLTFTDGLTNLGLNALPGFVTAVHNAEAPMRGLSSILGETGTGLSLFFTNLSTGAQSSEQVMQTFGGVIQDLLGFAGQLFANLSNGAGGALTELQGALRQVESVVLSLTSNGMPLLNGAFHGFITQVQGALGVLQGVTSLLGGWAGPIANIAGSLKALDLITFGKASGALKALYSDLKNAEGASAGFGSGLGSTATKAGVAGAAMVILGVALKAIGDASQEAQAHLSQHQQTVDLLTAAYRQSGGVVDSTVEATLTTDKTFQAAAQSARVLGVNVQQMTHDMANGQGSLSATAQSIMSIGSALIDSAHPMGTFGDHMKDALHNTILYGGAADKVSGDIDGLTASFQVNTHASDAETATYREKITRLFDLAGQYNQTSGAAQEAARAEALYKQYLDTIPTASRDAQAGSKALSSAIDAIRDSATGAADKGKALLLVLDQLSGRSPSYEEATQSINDTIRQFADSMDKGAAASGRFDKSMINADGTINSATKNGSALLSQMLSLEKGFSDAAGSVTEMVQAGTPLPVALEKINDQALASRDAFIKQAGALGFSKDQAARLADTYHVGNQALGEYLSTLNTTDLAVAGITRTVDTFGNSIYHLPDGKTVVVGADTAGAEANVKRFKSLADATTAQTTVGANIDPATNRVLDWKNTTFQTVGNTTTYTNTDPATGQVRTWKVTTDATGARTTTFSTTDPASGAVNTFVRDTNGRWAQVNVGANTGPAQSALSAFYSSYIHDVTVGVTYRANNSVPLPLGGGAHGGVVKPFASGGIAAFSDGGTLPDLTPMSSLASVVPPNTWRVVGDNLKVPEAYIPLDRSARSNAILDEANTAMGRGGATVVAPSVDYGALAGAVAEAMSAVFTDGVKASFDPTTLEKGLITLARRRAGR